MYLYNYLFNRFGFIKNIEIFSKLKFFLKYVKVYEIYEDVNVYFKYLYI